MSQATATVQMRTDGVVVIPQEVRKVLEIDGQREIVEVTVRLPE